MKVDLTIPPELVSAIVDGVVARLKPILAGLQTNPSQADDPMVNYLGGVGSISSSRDEGKQDRQRVLPREGYLRLKEVLVIIPVSKSTWYKGVADGRYPKPTKKFGSRITAWDVQDIRALLDNKVAVRTEVRLPFDEGAT